MCLTFTSDNFNFHERSNERSSLFATPSISGSLVFRVWGDFDCGCKEGGSTPDVPAEGANEPLLVTICGHIETRLRKCGY